MSDSGRQIGDCRHGCKPRWCALCLQDALAAAEARAEQLRAALEPFAAYASVIDARSRSAGFSDYCPIRCQPERAGDSPTLGDCRRAKAALDAAGGAGDG